MINAKNNVKIIGIDHGSGNMKTANCVFGTGVLAYDKEPVFKSDMLVWNSRYYLIGTGHKEFTADKMQDEDYYVLTLAAVARELNVHGICTADVFLAAGLPLTWVAEQKATFRDYLMQNKTVDFIFRGKKYHIHFVGVELFAQGFAAAYAHIKEFTGVNMLCDIGNGTMNLMFINDKKPDPRKCYTEKFGTHQCMLQVRENLMRLYHAEPPEEIVTRVLRFGEADIDPAYLKTITNTAREYVDGIFRRLREHGYDPRLMRLYVVGGGGCLIKNFAEYDENRVTINEDICATVKGYERMAEAKLLRAGDRK
jgi:plasmid segregation protein ParM